LHSTEPRPRQPGCSAARKVRLSLGDWACLALAQQRGAASTLTTDPRQAEVASTIGVTVELIR